MATPHKLKALQEARGLDLESVIPALLADLGTQKAVAEHLGLSQATISTWLRDNGYVPKVIYVKQGGSYASA